jgi:hypothetical protein
MELDLQFIWAPCAKLYSLAETRHPPPPSFGPVYEGAIGQPRYRRHLFVTPCSVFCLNRDTLYVLKQAKIHGVPLCVHFLSVQN